MHEKFSTGLSETERNRLERILQIREYAADHSIRKTAVDMKVSRSTVKRYLEGDAKELCRWHGDCNRDCEYGISRYLSFIIECVNKGLVPSDIHRELIQQFDYKGSFPAFYNHLQRNAKQYGWELRTKYNLQRPEKRYHQKVSRNDIFHYLWSQNGLQAEHKTFIFEKYPMLNILDRCIREFRDTFQNKCIHRLHCFINKYSSCGIVPLESFAKGLLNDIDAVEYAVSTEWSNGFVEGINNKIKMVKRVMFGRCNRALLEAKVLL